MQPNLSNSQSGLPYRKIVKRHFRRIKRFYLSVSVYESVSCDLFLAFLTDGNKSKCGTRLHLTHPQQPTEGPIFTALSPAKRQVLQGKPFTLSSARPRTAPHRHMPRATPRATHPHAHPNAPPPAPHTPPHPRITPLHHMPHHTAAPRARTTHAPAPSPPQSRMQFPHGTNRRTLKNRGISTIRLQNLKHSQGNCMRNCCARGRQGPADPTPPGGRREACRAWPDNESTRRAKLAAQADHLQALRIRIGNEHPDR